MDTLIRALSCRVPDIDQASIADVLQASTTVPLDNQLIRQRLLEKVQSTAFGSMIRSRSQRTNYDRLVRRYNPVIPDVLSDADRGCIETFRQELEATFCQDAFFYEHRVATQEAFCQKLRDNGTRAYFDIVGFRLVPRDPARLVDLVGFFKNRWQDRTLSWINTFLYSDEDFSRLISRNSDPFYRAVHCYLRLGRCFVEIQMRTPCIDAWSKLHHAVVYKPNIVASEEERLAIVRFGEVANIVDLSAMLR